ncbi:hypothetical protein MMC11_006625 [Xylographa trunciseda]|nr:hypothetical protein [Xylographa trunciseda]
MSNIVAFVEGYICLGGKLHKRSLYVDVKKGCIVDGREVKAYEIYNLHGQIIAPAFLELQTNGCAGFHFTNFETPESYQAQLNAISRYLVSTGVGSFWATLPTVSPKVFKQVLPFLKPQTFPNGAELLGAHCEGPWLNPAKKGAHDATLMQLPDSADANDIYGADNLRSCVKMVTLAPELAGSSKLISSLRQNLRMIVSIGHSQADYDTGIRALEIGASTLTHVFNAMEPFNHRSPGLAGLISSSQKPYYSIIADGIHLHPAVVSMAFRTNPERCILITDSVEMAGKPDGLYPGHAQVPHKQRKVGNKVTIEGTDTLIGSCISLDECVRNLVSYSGCSLAEAIRCVTENVANLMGIYDRGILAPGRRADLVILDTQGHVKGVWIKGQKVQ